MPQPKEPFPGVVKFWGNLASSLGRSISRLPIPWILAAAFGIRAVFVIAFAATSNWPNYGPLEGPAVSQAGVDGYIQIARSLVTSGEYAFAPGGQPVPFRPPVVPLLMAVFGAWSIHHWYWVWLAYSVSVGTSTLWVLHRCARELELGELPTRLILLATAFHPYLVFSTRVPALPVTLTFLCTIVAWCILRFVRKQGHYSMGLGLAWGLGALTHGSFLPLTVPFFGALLLVTDGTWRSRIRDVLVASFTCLLLVAPWTLRNQATLGTFVPVATGSGLQYWLGDAIYLKGDRKISSAFERVKSDFLGKTGRELQIDHGGVLNLKDDKVLSQTAKSELSAQPFIALKRILIGLPLFWTTMDGGWRKAMIVAAINLPIVISYGVILISLVLKSRGSRAWLACSVFLLGYWSLFALVQAVGPYFVSITPCLLLLLVSGSVQAFRGPAPPACCDP